MKWSLGLGHVKEFGKALRVIICSVEASGIVHIIHPEIMGGDYACLFSVLSVPQPYKGKIFSF